VIGEQAAPAAVGGLRLEASAAQLDFRGRRSEGKGKGQGIRIKD